MEKEREEIKDAIEKIKKSLKDEFMSGIFYKSLIYLVLMSLKEEQGLLKIQIMILIMLSSY